MKRGGGIVVGMAAHPAPALAVSEAEAETLRSMMRAGTTEQRLAMRARIILRAAEGAANAHVARELGVSIPTVLLWRRRFKEQGLAGLEDAPHPGRPRTYGREVREHILTVTLTPPEGATHWSTRRLATRVGVSAATVGRVWKEGGLKPHRSETFKYMPSPRQPRTASRAATAVTSTVATSTTAPARGTPRRRRRGRPPLLDEGKREVLLKAIRAGNRPSVAARYAGVSPKSMAEWMRRGRGVDVRSKVEPYIGFVRAVEHAEAVAEVEAVASIWKAMPRNPKYAIWWLERMHPEWRRRKLAPVAEVTSASPAPLVQNTILVEGATLRRLTRRSSAPRMVRRISMRRRGRRARLVSGSP